MRDAPYPARFYAFSLDEPFVDDSAASLANDTLSAPLFSIPLFPISRRLQRILLLLLTIYLGCAIFLILTVSSYAAPRGDVTISPHNNSPTQGCFEAAALIIH